jgi:para-nitrobenzyl esterase
MQTEKSRDVVLDFCSGLSPRSSASNGDTHVQRAGKFLKVRTAALVLSAIATVGAHAEENHLPTTDSGIVKIDSGAVEGTTVNGASAYLGIPYAAPPVGGLRWRPPQPPAAWKTTLHAAKFAHTCAQNTDFGDFSSPSTDEDCLYLNVYTPPGAAAHKGKLPVMFWILGGAEKTGESNDYDGSKLAVAGNTIVVTFNYRLGALGELAHPALDNTGEAFGNYGFMDQQFALRWVQKNIAAFGGDRGNVTIFGQSMGGAMVTADLISPQARGLFQHAISESGAYAIYKQVQYSKSAAEAKGIDFAKEAGCADQTAECLRNLQVSEILAHQTSHLLSGGFIFDPNSLLPRSFQDAFSSGEFAHVPFINGTNRDEYRWSVGLPEENGAAPLSSDGYPAAVGAFWGPSLQDRIIELYPLREYPSPDEALAAAETDYIFSCPAHKLDDLVSSAIPTYAYEFNDITAPAYMPTVSFPFGAYHTGELQYLFPQYHGGTGTVHPLNPSQQHLSDVMVNLWTKFARAKGTEPWSDRTWQKYDSSRQYMTSLQLPEPQAMDGKGFAKFHRCDFWDSLNLY